METNSNIEMRDLLMYVWIRCNYNYDKSILLLKDSVTVRCDSDTLFKLNQLNKNYICILDDIYPTKLKQLDKPPICLFYKGDITLIHSLCIGIIGSRLNDDYGEKVVNELVSRLPSNCVVVSGLAKGIDGLAHRMAIKYGIKTIGIIGSGLSNVYPICNKDLYEYMEREGLILSEYEYNESIRKEHFVARNRIIAAMSDILVVVESTLHSGTLITVNDMLSLGKEVYVVPHSLFSKLGEGNLRLLSEGANILYNIDEFVNSLKRV